MMTRITVCFLLAGAIAGPVSARAQGPPRPAENILIVTLDGFRPQEFFGGADESLIDPKAGGVRDVAALKARYLRPTAEGRREALLPFVWGTVAKEGQVFGDRSRKAAARLTNGKKFSYPGYNELFCGFGDDRIDSNDKKPNPNRSVLEFLDDRPAFRGRVAIFGTWDVFPSIFRTDQNRLRIQSGWTPIDDPPLTDRQRSANTLMEGLPRVWADNVFDVVTIEAAREHLVRHKPRVCYIALGETDEWAHLRRYDLYLSSAHEADRQIGELWRTLQAMPEYRDKTALLLTTDHGRGVTKDDWIGHGAKVEGAEFLWIAAMGPGTPALGVREGIEANQSQVAATIALWLGENFQAVSPRSSPPLSGIAPASP